MRYHVVSRENPQNREISKFYPSLDYDSEIDITSLSDEISYASSINSSDVRAVIESFLKFVPLHIMNGNTVRLGDFGIFKIGIQSKGEANAEDVSGNSIVRTHILFRPGAAILSKIQNMKFTRA